MYQNRNKRASFSAGKQYQQHTTSITEPWHWFPSCWTQYLEQSVRPSPKYRITGLNEKVPALTALKSRKY